MSSASSSRCSRGRSRATEQGQSERRQSEHLSERVREPRPVRVAVLEERVAALDRLVREVRQPGGLAGQQVFAGEATRLAYLTDEAVEGRDAFLEHRDPDWSGFPYAF